MKLVKYFMTTNCEKNIGKILFISSFILYFISLFIYYHDNVLRYDEVFSFALISNSSIHSIIYLTSLDVHPPLFYLILKFFISFGHYLHLPFNDIFLGRLAASLPFLILMIFSFKYLRRDIGYLESGLFSFSLMTMPQFIHYLTEARMYSYSLLFLTLAFYMAYKISSDGSWKNHVLLIVFILLGLYTQYFFGLYALGIVLLLLVILSLNNDIDKIKKLFISGIVCIIIYLGTWGLFLYNQVKTVTNNYWIAPFNGEALINTIIYFLNPLKLSESSVDLIDPQVYQWMSVIYEKISYEMLFFIILLVIVFEIIIKKTLGGDLSLNKLKDKILKTNFLTFGALVTIAGLIFALMLPMVLGKPVIHIRYLFMSMGLFWLTIVIVIGKLKHSKSKTIFGVCMILLIVGGLLSAYDSLNLSVINQRYSQDIDNTLKLIDSNDLILTESTGEQTYIKLLHPHLKNIVIYKLGFLQKAYSNILSENKPDGILDDVDELTAFNNTLKSGNKVWILSSKSEFDELYYFNNIRYGFLDSYYIKHYRMSFVSNTNYQIGEVIEISSTPI